MIRVETVNDNVNVVIPVTNDPGNIDAISKCQAIITEDLLYLYKTIEDNYGKDALFFMLNMAATTYTLKHDEL